jgi:hypothetical protein
MFVKALQSFATADLKVSLGVGFVHEIEDEELANQLIADGLVEKYEEIHPNGEIAITQNGTVDVSRYKTAKVNCGQWKVTFDGNNEQNETIAVFAVKGSSISLLGEENFTTPEGMQLEGWATTKTADAPDIEEAPYTPTKDTVLFAVWEETE